MPDSIKPEIPPAVDRRAFRTALGRFPTGVTVVTTRGPRGEPIGLTANSFNSVSLDPPLVLWSLAKSASVRPIFEAAPYYAINVLAADQIGVARQFASRSQDRFAGTDWGPGLGEVPLIAGCAARFECRNLARYEGGDHLIFLGQVERFSDAERPALAYHASDYMVTAHHPERLAAPEGERFIDDDLPHLLARASHRASGPFALRLRRAGIALPQWRVLGALAEGPPVAVSRLAHIVLMKQPTVTKLVDRMAQRGLVARVANREDRRQVLVRATAKGRTIWRGLARAARSHEVSILAGYGYGEAALLKAALRALIARLGAGEGAEREAKAKPRAARAEGPRPKKAKAPGPRRGR